MSWLGTVEGTCAVCGDLPILPRQRGQDSARGDARPGSATNGTWQVRVVANKFAAVGGYQAHASHSPLTPEHGRFLIQDVIVESPNHADGTCLMDESHVGGLDRRIAHGEALHRTAKIQISITISAQRPRNAGLKYFHWYLSIIPRNAAAEFLRTVQLERAAGA